MCIVREVQEWFRATVRRLYYAINVVREVQEKFRATDRKLYYAFVDLEEAFGSKGSGMCGRHRRGGMVG